MAYKHIVFGLLTIACAGTGFYFMRRKAPQGLTVMQVAPITPNSSSALRRVKLRTVVDSTNAPLRKHIECENYFLHALIDCGKDVLERLTHADDRSIRRKLLEMRLKFLEEESPKLFGTSNWSGESLALFPTEILESARQALTTTDPTIVIDTLPALCEAVRQFYASLQKVNPERFYHEHVVLKNVPQIGTIPRLKLSICLAELLAKELHGFLSSQVLEGRIAGSVSPEKAHQLMKKLEEFDFQSEIALAPFKVNFQHVYEHAREFLPESNPKTKYIAVASLGLSSEE